MVTKVSFQAGFNRAANATYKGAKFAHNKGDKIWKYAKPVDKMTYAALKICKISKYTKEITKESKGLKELNKLISVVKALSLISLYYETIDLYGLAKKCHEDLYVKKDITSFVISLLNLLATLGSITKCIDDLLSAAEILLNKAGVNILDSVISKIVLICGIYITIRGWYELAHQGYQLYDMHKSIPKNITTDKDLQKLIAYLDKKLKNDQPSWYDGEEIVKSSVKLFLNRRQKNNLETKYNKYISSDGVKTRIIKRNTDRVVSRTDKKVVNIMKNLQAGLAEDTLDFQTANDAVQDMKSLMNRKITVGVCVSLVGTALNATSIATLFFAVPALTMPILLLNMHLTILIKNIYMQNFSNRGLNCPKFTAYSSKPTKLSGIVNF